MSTKTGSRSSAPGRGALSTEETEAGPKPLAQTLLQEFKNLQDKFKNDEDSLEKGHFPLSNFFKFTVTIH